MDISQIKSPKRKRGRPHITIFQKWASPSKLDALKRLYERIAERKRKYKGGKRYGTKDKIIDAIAAKYHVVPDQLRVQINRTAKHRSIRKKPKE